jgi:acetyltransferase-like isoleucine patch superfamily enzyme
MRIKLIQDFIDRLRKKERKNYLGEFSYLQDTIIASPETTIGKFCSIASGVSIGTSQHPTNYLSTHPFQYLPACELPTDRQYLENLKFDRVSFASYKPVTVENDVWIGANAIIMDGLKISNGAVVAAGAVVTKDVPPYAIVGGVPAKVIKYRFSQEIIDELLELKWWDRPIETIVKLPFDDIIKCIELLK